MGKAAREKWEFGTCLCVQQAGKAIGLGLSLSTCKMEAVAGTPFRGMLLEDLEAICVKCFEKLTGSLRHFSNGY